MSANQRNKPSRKAQVFLYNVIIKQYQPLPLSELWQKDLVTSSSKRSRIWKATNPLLFLPTASRHRLRFGFTTLILATTVLRKVSFTWKRKKYKEFCGSPIFALVASLYGSRKCPDSFFSSLQLLAVCILHAACLSDGRWAGVCWALFQFTFCILKQTITCHGRLVLGQNAKYRTGRFAS